MTSRHALLTVDGLIHASRVIAVVSCNEAELLIVTNALVPLKTNALPYLPELVQVVPLTVPLFPFPELSATVVPDPSLNEYAATNPLAWAGDTAPSQSRTDTTRVERISRIKVPRLILMSSLHIESSQNGFWNLGLIESFFTDLGSTLLRTALAFAPD